MSKTNPVEIDNRAGNRLTTSGVVAVALLFFAIWQFVQVFVPLPMIEQSAPRQETHKKEQISLPLPVRQERITVGLVAMEQHPPVPPPNVKSGPPAPPPDAKIEPPKPSEPTAASTSDASKAEEEIVLDKKPVETVKQPSPTRNDDFKKEKKKTKPKRKTPQNRLREAEEVRRGKNLLAGKDERGEFPPIRVDYNNINFERYIHEMAKAGGRFFIIDLSNNSMMGEYDPERDVYIRNFSASFEGLTERPRIIDGDPDSERIVDQAVNNLELAPGNYALIFLMNQRMDAVIAARLDARLDREKKSYADFEAFFGEYFIVNGGLHLLIKKGIERDGTDFIIEESFDLS